MTVWRNRVIGLTTEVPEDLLAHPANARRHPPGQRDALRASLNELGWAAPVIVNERTGFLLDGHARVEEAISAGVPAIPVVHVDLDEDQEALFLAVYDPIAGMAKFDQERLEDLIASITTADPALEALLATLSGEDIDGAAIHGPKPAKGGKLVLNYDDDDYAEVIAMLSLAPGRDAADKVIRLLRQRT